MGGKKTYHPMQTQRKVNHWHYMEKGKSLSLFRACDCSSRHTANPLRWHFWDSNYNCVSPGGSFTFYSKSLILTMVPPYCQSSNRWLRADLKHSNELPILSQKNRPGTQSAGRGFPVISADDQIYPRVCCAPPGISTLKVLRLQTVSVLGNCN